MNESNISKVNSISDLHVFNRIPPPEHPLISLIDYSKTRPATENNEMRWMQGFYSISIKRNVLGKYRYGHQSYDFDEGLMTFFSPDQVITVEMLEGEDANRPAGWILAIHPDFLSGTSLASKIKKNKFFYYSVKEALFLSDEEEVLVTEIFQKIKAEYQSHHDHHSTKIIVNQIELLLSYAERFYERQFLTRKTSNNQVLNKLEDFLEDWFTTGKAENNGLPSVQSIAQDLNFSPDYLSSMLKNLTGQSTQKYIHNKIIEQAKVILSTSNLSISETAYKLGFEHPQSFSKFFKSKTALTPMQYRKPFK